jgi:hypothetical protein
MKRLSSQLIITESAEVLRNSIVQISEIDINYHSVVDGNHETAHTIFFDGIISPPIISLTKCGINKSEIENCGYELILFEDLIKEKSVEDKKIIIDFGTEDLLIINTILKNNNNKLNNFDSTYFIIACTASPNLFLKNTNKTPENRTLWSGTNLIDKKITGQTSVSIV